MSDASSTDTPQAADPEEVRREGEAAENARMAAETARVGGKTTGTVPWAETGQADASRSASSDDPASKGNEPASTKRRPAPRDEA